MDGNMLEIGGSAFVTFSMLPAYKLKNVKSVILQFDTVMLLRQGSHSCSFMYMMYMYLNDRVNHSKDYMYLLIQLHVHVFDKM